MTPFDPVHAFDALARAHPGAVAVARPAGASSERWTLTYGELRDRARALHGHLIAHLADPPEAEPIVGLFMAREDPDMIAAQVACLGAGLAYLPLDPKQPDAYLAGVAQDAGARVILTARRLEGRAAQTFEDAVPVLLAEDAPAAPVDSPWPLDVPTDRLAYVIYTSGTTGKPKGVLLEREGLGHLIDEDRGWFGLGPGDRVAHGSSPGYDSAVEEVWMALSTGAAVVIVDDVTLRLGPDLVPWLARERVTVLCPPPTLLRTLGDVDPVRDLPALRWLYVGGEALPEDIARRFGGGSRGEPGPRLVNGYGPTEATVTATRWEVSDPADVRIGRAVRGARAVVVRADGRECGEDEEGELWIAGSGVARGYLGRPELTAERFPANTPWGRVYRTGDLARRPADGELVFLGRMDRQVQLRGHRVELAAVEAALAAEPEVLEAACDVEGSGARQVLVAWVVPAPDAGAIDGAALTARLARSLPEPMVPAHVRTLDVLPRSASGKLDRKRLPRPETTPAAPTRDLTEDERAVSAAVQRAMDLGAPPDPAADLFETLGADSLAAAMIVSEIRRHPRGARVTVRDIYGAPTVEQLARRLDDRPAPVQDAAPASRPTAAGAGQRMAFTAAQVLWMGLEAAAALALLGYVLFPVLFEVLDHVPVIALLLLAAPLATASRVALLPFAMAWAKLVQRLVLPRYSAGRHPAFGLFHLRHWIVSRAAGALPFEFLRGTEGFAALARFMGARVGRGVHFHRGVSARGAWNLMEIGDGAWLAQDAQLRTVEPLGGELVVGPVSVGSGARLDVRAAMGPGSALGDGGHLGPLAHLEGAAGPGERWEHTPARATGAAAEAAPPPAGRGEQVALFAEAFGLGWLRSLAATGTLWLVFRRAGVDLDAFVHGALTTPADAAPGFRALAVAACATVLVDLLLLGALARVIGARALGIGPAARRCAWHAAGLVDAAGTWLSGSVFWPGWLRLAGMRVGRGAEVSSIIDTVPASIEIGADSFLADGVYLGSASMHGDPARPLPEARMERDTFAGNHAILPPGRVLPSGSLAGVCTVVDDNVTGPGAWFGQPAFPLARSGATNFDRSTTHEPGPVRRVNRVFWEALRLALPAVGVALLFVWLGIIEYGAPERPTLTSLLMASAAAGALSLGGAILLKWLLLGRVRAGEHPLWSCWCSRWDFHYVVWGLFGRPLTAALEGTLLLPFVLRTLGMRIGRGVLLGPGFSQVVDPDMLTFRDCATVASHFQAHTFEDRVLKIAPLEVGPGATLGTGSLAFYGLDAEPGSLAAPGGVAMKGERLEAGRRYVGAPLVPDP